MAKKEKFLQKKLLRPIFKQFTYSLVDLVNIFNITQDDCDAIFEKHSEDTENQLWRRLYIKTIFSHIEAVCFCMKQLAYFTFEEYKENRGGKLLREEVSMLLEDSYYLDDHGDAKKGKAYLKSQWNLQFAFKMLARAIKKEDFTLGKGREGWHSYTKGVDIRNRITHPKNAKALTITDEEMEEVKKALKWFREQFNQLVLIKYKITEVEKKKNKKVNHGNL